MKQSEMLRKQCLWQRAESYDLNNGYPYRKHQPDCDICRSADLIEELEEKLAEYKKLEVATQIIDYIKDGKIPKPEVK